MHTGLVTCAPQTKLGEAARLLLASRVHALVVLGSDEAPLGVLTDFDLLAGEWLSTNPSRLEEMKTVTAGDLMTSPVASIEATASAEDAAERMARDRIARLVVLEGRRAIGTIAISDILTVLAVPPHGRSTVGDVMSRSYLVCRPDAPISDAARGLVERHARSVVVLDDHGTAIGILTSHDLLALYPDHVAGVTAADQMHPPLTTTADTALAQAIDVMIRNEVHRLVVLNAATGGVPVGLISSWDVLAEMAGPQSPWQVDAT